MFRSDEPCLVARSPRWVKQASPDFRTRVTQTDAKGGLGTFVEATRSVDGVPPSQFEALPGARSHAYVA